MSKPKVIKHVGISNRSEIKSLIENGVSMVRIPRFKPGQPVIYTPTDPEGNVYKIEYGIVKRMNSSNTCAFVWYHSGCTAAATPVEYLTASVKLKEHEHCHTGCEQCLVDDYEDFIKRTIR